MPGFQMFPRFPEIGDHAPSLESIRSKNPMAFAVFWALLFFFSMVVVPCLLVRYNFLGSFLISFPVLILANLFILYSLASAAEELGKFQTIDDLDDSERWTYDGVVRFFAAPEPPVFRRGDGRPLAECGAQGSLRGRRAEVRRFVIF